MICLAQKLTKLISVQPFCVLVVLIEISITGLSAPPSSACCYDPPDYADTANQAQPSTNDPSSQAQPSSADLSGQASQNNATAPDVPEEAQVLLYSSEPSEQGGSSSEGTDVQNFMLIRQYIADGQYLRAKQIAEKQLEVRPFDFQLWGLLETIYNKIGLQKKTSTAAKNKELMNPRRRAPPQPAPQVSQQKRYVVKLLQAIGEYKPVE